MRIAQREEVLIYAIGLLGDESPRAAEKARRDLDVLAQATGGQTYYPADVAEIARIAPRIAQELRNQYILSYTPTNPEADGLFRQIRVVVDAPGVQIRTRSGYYAAAPAN
jgi:Ca-activated chloride channel homolog